MKGEGLFLFTDILGRLEAFALGFSTGSQLKVVCVGINPHINPCADSEPLAYLSNAFEWMGDVAGWKGLVTRIGTIQRPPYGPYPHDCKFFGFK